MPTYPENSAPYISVVVAARNDNHGGNMIGRMQAFLDSWIIQASRHNLPSEIIVVEWNPPADRGRLMDELRWPPDMGPCEARFIEVSREVHDRLPHAAAIPLHQMIAKNAGIRRARGQFVLATNLDIIFSAELMRFLGERRLERGKMYRLDRTNVASYIPAGATVDELLAFCESHMLRIFAREGVYESYRGMAGELSRTKYSRAGGGYLAGNRLARNREIGPRPYRWVEPEAEIVFERPPEAAPRLLIDAEAAQCRRQPLVVEVVSPAGRVLTSARVDGACKLRLHIPDHLSSGTLRLRLQGRKLPLARTPRFLMLRVFGLKWEVPPKWLAGVSLVRGTQSARESTVLVRSAEARMIQLAIRPGPDSSLETLEVKLTDPAGNVVFHAGVRLPAFPWNRDEGEYLLSLNLGFKLSDNSAGRSSLSHPMSTGYWKYWIPTAGRLDHISASAHGGRRRIANAAYLHTSACGDFTLLSREDWLALRGYPEFPIWPMNIDLLFCYAAHHAGIGEVVLTEPMRVYHTEHLSAAGWTPEGEEERAARIEAKGVPEIPFATATEWIDRMRRFNAPMIFALANWGLADVMLPETKVQGSSTVMSPKSATRTASLRHGLYVVAVLLLPLLVLWHRDNVLYSPPLHTDPWFYLGYFKDLVDFKRDLFPGFHMGSRYSWILPGYLVHSLFSPSPPTSSCI